MKNKYIRQAIALCEEGIYTDAELYVYEKYWDAVRIEKSSRSENIMKGKKIGLEEGLAEGMKKGREEGLAEGMERGREKGLAEGREKGLAEGMKKGREEGLAEGMEKVVIKSFKNSVSLENISALTELSIDEIISILQKHKLIE
jgi:flagellar biosynthesis/type III secretory pathway protein FliH